MCALCETFFTQESFRRCGLRKPAKGLEECSEKEQRSFSCPHHLKLDFAESSSAGLLSPRPRFLSSRKERNQRFAKEEVSSLDSPLRGFSPRELRLAKFSPPVCSANKQMSGIAPATSGSRRLCRYPSAPIAGGCPILPCHLG